MLYAEMLLHIAQSHLQRPQQGYAPRQSWQAVRYPDAERQPRIPYHWANR
jgi:hypothetical protein